MCYCIMKSEREVLWMKHESKITEGADFIMDSKVEHSKNIFSKRMKITLWITVILTGFLSIGAVGSFFWAVVDRMWQEWGNAEFVLRELIHLCILMIVLGGLLKAGLEMQREVDTIL